MNIFDIGFLYAYKAAILIGLVNTFAITILAIGIGSALAVLLVVGQLSANATVRFLSRAYVDFFVAVPILVLLIWIYYCLPSLGIQISSYWTAVVALSLSLSAFAAELIRGAVLTVPAGQIEAARLVGITEYDISRSIVWPQVARSIAPALLNEYVTTLKLSTVASIIAAPELSYQSSLIISQTYRPLEVYTALALIFAIIIIPLLRFGQRLEKARMWKI